MGPMLQSDSCIHVTKDASSLLKVEDGSQPGDCNKGSSSSIGDSRNFKQGGVVKSNDMLFPFRWIG